MTREFKPGITCRVIDHPQWTNPLKHQIIGLAVVLVYPVTSRTAPPAVKPTGWKVTGLPPSYVAARKRERPWFRGCFSESILEPLPPISLEDETETNIGATRHHELV